MWSRRFDGESRFARVAARIAELVAFPALLLLALGGLYAVGDAVLAPIPEAESPGFIDVVLASRAVVAAIRLALIFASGFIVVSVVALVARGQWLVRVGPVEVSEQLSGLSTENARLEQLLDNAEEAMESLRGQVTESNGMLERMRSESK